MTVQELIDELLKIEDKTLVVEASDTEYGDWQIEGAQFLKADKLNDYDRVNLY